MARSKRKKGETSTKEVPAKGKVIPLTGAIKGERKGAVSNSKLRTNSDAGMRVTPWRRTGVKSSNGESFWPVGGNQTLFTVAFAGLLLLLFYPPFFRGLFFPVEQRWTLLLAAVLFILTYLWKLSRREVFLLNRPLDFAAAALVIVYILAAIKPASRSLAVNEVAKVLLYFLTFWLTSRLAGQRRTLYLLHALYLAATGVALAALLSATGIVYIKDGFVGGRFYSTLQYPNALASYVGAASIIGFYFWAQSDSRRRYLYAAANYLLLLVFLGTGSRGAYLVFPVVILLYWLLAPKGYRLNTLAHIMASALAAFTGIARFIPLAVAKAYTPAWTWFAAGLLVALTGQLIIQVAALKLPTARMRMAAVVAVLVLLAAGGIFSAFKQAAVMPAGGDGQSSVLLARILPPQIMNRLKDFSLETKSSRERLIWTGDAMKMIRDRPILGFGGGGWEAAYRQYQSYFYNSTQVHNDYAQEAVANGLTGLAVIGIIWLFFFYTIALNYRFYHGTERLQSLAIGTAALNLGLHAAIDFDLALGAVSMMLWAYFGLARGIEGQRLGSEPALAVATLKNKQGAFITGAALATLVIVLFCISYLAGVSSARRAAAALQQNNLQATVSYLEEAGRYDPFTASYDSDLAGIYLKLGKAREALELALAASNKEPYNLTILNRLAEAYWQNGEVEQALAVMERVRQVAPWVGSGWENLGKAYVAAGISYLQIGREDEARLMFEQAASLPAAVEEKVNSLGEFKELHQAGGVALTPVIQLQGAIGHYFLGQEKEAASRLSAAAKDPQVKPEAQLWQAVLAYRQGDTGRSGQLLDQVKNTNAALAKQFDQLKNLPVLSK